MVVINLVLKNHEPQINADERRLNVLFLDIIGVALEKEREWLLNLWRVMGKDKNQSGIKRNLLALINDKSRATNLRLSAFICGLKFDNSRHSNFILKIKYQSLLFVNQISVSFFYPEKDGAAYG